MNKAHITLLNLNMLYLKYYDTVDREYHLPLGMLYVTKALETAGFTMKRSRSLFMGSVMLLVLEKR